MKKSETYEALKKACDGLLFPSETDASLDPFEWSGEEGKPTKARVLHLAGVDSATQVKVTALRTFFRDVTAERDWHDDEESARVQQFRQLEQTLEKTLSDVKVFQIGKLETDVYIVGRSASGWVGLKTRVVKT